jgi:hypothetical protein
MYSLGSSGGSYCTIHCTAGISSPRAATSVQSSTPLSALLNSRNVAVRRLCFCLPWILLTCRHTMVTTIQIHDLHGSCLLSHQMDCIQAGRCIATETPAQHHTSASRPPVQAATRGASRISTACNLGPQTCKARTSQRISDDGECMMFMHAANTP